MIEYAELERAIDRWKARAAAAGAAAVPPEGAEGIEPADDYAASGEAAPEPDGAEAATSDGVEASDEYASAPTQETTGDSTSEIDVNQIEPEPEDEVEGEGEKA